MIHHRGTENTENESEAPNSKLQIPISKDAFPKKILLLFGIGFFWFENYLDFGIWCSEFFLFSVPLW